MQFKKKCLIMLTVLIMEIVSCFSGVSAYEITEDIVGIKNQNQIEFLLSLGIVENYVDDTFKPDKSVSKIEFLMMVVNMMNVDIANNKGNTYFYDVQPESGGYGYVSFAVEQGLIKVSDDRMFNPSKTITQEEAIELLVNAAGYEYLAYTSGGYPNGYISVAQTKDITKSFAVKVGSELSRADACQLIYNTLMTDVIEINDYSNQTFNTVQKKGYNKYFNLIKNNGIIIDNGITSIYSENTEVGENNISIQTESNDIIVLNAGNLSVKNLLGINVDFYYDENEETLSFIKENRDNDIIKSDSEDINTADTSASNLSLDNQNGKIKNYKLSKNIAIIYNNKMTEFNVEHLKMIKDDQRMFGTITINDYNNDGVYDIVFIDTYDIYIIDNVNANSERIYATDAVTSNEIIMDLSQYESYTLEKNGADSSLTALKKDDVISVYSTLEEMQTVKIIICDEKVSGKVYRAGGDSEVYSELTIEDKEYKGIKNLKLYTGTSGTFLINHEGIICSVAWLEGSDILYGYLYNYYISDYGDEALYVKLFNEYSEWIDVEVDNKISINGKSAKKEAIIALTQKQLIKYQLNNEGKLKKIYADIEDGTEFVVKSEQMLDAKYNNYSKGFANADNSILVNDTTKIFMVGTGNEKEDFAIVSPSYFITNSNYNVQAYNSGDYKVADALVAFSKESSNVEVKSGTGYMVNEVSYKLDDDEQPSYFVSLVRKKDNLSSDVNGEMIELKVSDKYAGTPQITELKCGDVVYLGLNHKEEIQACTMFRSIDNVTEKSRPNAINVDDVWTSGRVVQVYGDIIVIDDDGNEDNYRGVAYNKYLSYVAVYDEEEEKAMPGSMSDIAVGDYVLLSTKSGTCISQLFVFKMK